MSSVHNFTSLLSSNTIDYDKIYQALQADPNLAKTTFPHENPFSKENEEVPLFTLTYAKANDERMQALRRKFFDLGANVNYQFPDGSTLGHSFASAAAATNRIEAYLSLIDWIQDGGDVSLKDRSGDHPINVVTKSDPLKQKPGTAAVRSILIGLDKRQAFPTRIVDNMLYDNADEIAEAGCETPVLLAKMATKMPSMKSAYKCNTIAYRAYREVLNENGANINVELQSEAGGTLGHIFAMEAANRNDERHYIRLIRWIRDGGDLDYNDNLGMTPTMRLYCYANHPGNDVPFHGLNAALALLDHVKPDQADDPARLTDSRAPKYNPHPSKEFKIFRASLLDDPSMEKHLHQTFKQNIIDIFMKRGLNIKEILTAPLVIQTKLIVS